MILYFSKKYQRVYWAIGGVLMEKVWYGTDSYHYLNTEKDGSIARVTGKTLEARHNRSVLDDIMKDVLAK